MSIFLTFFAVLFSGIFATSLYAAASLACAAVRDRRESRAAAGLGGAR